MNFDDVKDKIYYFFWDLIHSCELGRGFFFEIYKFLAGKMECKCCIFWRGIGIGLLVSVILQVIRLWT